ncbi:MAG: branched-chain amino acid ABC transporter permease [Chloroflexota bacterium]|nr:branched-chain amino acid ABC transporter permease [Chloroflexota bacterium]
MNDLIVQSINSIVFSMLLFVMAAGLSLIFGHMNFINLAHGSFYVLGGYIGYTMISKIGSYWMALIIVPILVGLVGATIEFLFLRRLYGKHRHLEQVLFTMGLALITADIIRSNWGTYVVTVKTPLLLDGSISILDSQFPLYRLVVIGIGLTIAVVLWILMQRTRLGIILRAGVFDKNLVSESGINIQAIFTGIFGLGSALAALAGVIGAPLHSLYPGLQFEILVLTLAVVIVGGLGSLQGAFFGSLLIGIADTFGKALLPEISLFLIFALMAIVLLVKPRGLFGAQSN